uniref:Uncharacterized protein n=1 Tax=Arundo donax TaxID=35708 RepID=A0A0A8YJ55_ARUDO
MCLLCFKMSAIAVFHPKNMVFADLFFKSVVILLLPPHINNVS